MLQLKSKIVIMRNVIREHRDQKGDDRYWVDDYLIWELLKDSPKKNKSLLVYQESMKKCTEFFKYRNSKEKDATLKNAILDKEHWDDDLKSMNYKQLNQENSKLEEHIRNHRDINNRVRTIEDDRILYQALPENLSADFRLPSEEEFLGVVKNDAGCPNFWRSHSYCKKETHNLHEWSPCKD